MNPKNLLTATVATVMLAGCGTHDKKEGSTTQSQDTAKQIKHNTSKGIHDTLSHNTAEYQQSDSNLVLFDIKAMIKDKDPAMVDTKNRTLSYMLGPDVNDIIKLYNPKLADSRPADYNRSWHDIRQVDTLYTPHIFPSMASFFNTTLGSFLLDKQELRDSVGTDQTVVIVTELPDKSFGMGYYKDGILAVASPTSIGKGTWNTDKKTGRRFKATSPQGRHRILRKEPMKKSFARDAMAYFNEVDDKRGLGLHGQHVHSTTDEAKKKRLGGKRESHGCFRLPQLVAKMLNEETTASKDSNIGTPFVGFRKQNLVEQDSTEYYIKYARKNAIDSLEQKQRIEKRDSIRRAAGDTVKILPATKPKQKIIKSHAKH